MQALNQFSIPIKGLNFGKHEFEFDVENSFFTAFDDSPVKSGQLISKLILDRKTNHLELAFSLDGAVGTECDRCTADILLPIFSEINFIVKFSEEEKSNEEIVYIHPDSHELNVAELIYEQLVLSLPMIKVFDCEQLDPIPCNQKVLNLLEGERPEEVVKNNPFGDALKDLKITKTK